MFSLLRGGKLRSREGKGRVANPHVHPVNLELDSKHSYITRGKKGREKGVTVVIDPRIGTPEHLGTRGHR